ncbi:MAG TPA: class I SAM-dependent methyltransferase [Chthoniobacterales bacterium]|nr:class I SAM-dependent methyltransferase [Chthoniobacterales bacterium]
MSFDRVAPHYRWLETVAFGQQLQQARLAFVRRLEAPRRALVVGEGNGRFLAALLREDRAVRVDCVEASGRMIALARTELDVESRVNFIHAEIQTVKLVAQRYDLIVTHFFLDCFSKETLAAVIAKLANSAAPQAQWLVADFCQPRQGWRSLCPRLLIAMMYLFFRILAGIEARRLVDYRPFLRAEGFILAQETLSPNKMIRSELWRHTLSTG